MSNNVGTPLFYVGIGLFAIFFLYQLDIASGTNMVDNAVTKAVTNAISKKGGSATLRHKKKHGKGKTHKKY